MKDENKAMFDKFSQKVKDVTDTVGQKANDLIEEGKLLFKIRDIEKDIEKLFYELGRLIYDAQENLSELKDEKIREMKAVIDEKKGVLIELRHALAELKGEKFCSNCHTNNRTDSNYCNKCGKPFEES